MSNDLSSAAAALGRRGGQSRSDAKIAAARENGRKGGRPVQYIYQTPDDWGVTTYASMERMEKIIESLREDGDEDWQEISIDDCQEWMHDHGDVYEETRQRYPDKARFEDIGDGYYELIDIGDE